MKLLQVPTANLEERIKEELEENPALEVTDEDGADNYEDKDEFADSTPAEEEYEGDDERDKDDLYENINISDYVQDGDDDIADYKMRDENYGEQEEKTTMPYKVETSFYEILEGQLGMLNLDERRYKISEQIIGSIDEDGYLRRETSAIVDDLAFRQNVDTTNAEVEEIIHLIQRFDPAGVCARNLQECLLLQLERHKLEGKEVDLAIQALTKYFDEFTKKHYEKIQRGLNLDDDQLREVMVQITKLNPKPGGNVGEINKAESYVVPDFFIYNNASKLELTLNSKNAPELRISEGYRDMLKEYDRGAKKDRRQKEAVLFIKQKIDAAKWFIDAIKQRQHTLFSSMTAIMNHQYDFFLTGDETNLRPMILKDIAERTGLDISTVSRVANS
ncbi:MAG TPA: RNA polymerase factor sigma-54, partial [Flavisolibacter sp.]|nr:RNA polymerase factor sigma-54 [Flavisolibacter sp.]